MSTVYTLTTLALTVGHWRFNGDLVDRSSSKINLSPTGSLTYTTGYTESGNTSIVVTGSAGAILPAASATNLNMGTSSFVIETILKTTETDAVNIIDKTDGDHGYKVGVTATGKLSFHVGTAAAYFSINSLSSINDNNWHYIVCECMRAGSILVLSIYIDGVVDYEDNTTLSGNISPTADFKVGTSNLDATIDEVCITRGTINPIIPAQIVTRYAGHGDPNTFNYSGSAMVTSNSVGTTLNTFDIQLKHECDHNLVSGRYTLSTCPRCLGTGYYYDIRFDSTGRPPTLSIENKLAQSLEKMILTTENKFHDNIVVGLDRHIGELTDDVEAIITYDIIQAIATLKENQRSVINLSPRAQIARLDSVNVIREDSSSLRYVIEIITVSGEKVELTGTISA